MSEISCSIITQPAGHGMKKRWNFVPLCCKKNNNGETLRCGIVKGSFHDCTETCRNNLVWLTGPRDYHLNHRFHSINAESPFKHVHARG